MKGKTDGIKKEHLKVAFYTRVSTTEQAKEGESLDVQFAALRTWGRMQKWQEAGQYTDDGYSGTSDKRPHFQRLVRDAQRGMFDAVAVAKIDRFMRNAPLFYKAIKELEDWNVAFISIQEGIDTSSKNTGTGKLFLNILASFAEFESARIGERVSEVRQSMTKEGRWGAGRPSYGYSWNKENHCFEVVEDEAEVIKTIFDLYVNKNMAMVPIAAWLNENGCRMRPRRDNKGEPFWSVRGVWSVLTNRAYTGESDSFKYPQIIDLPTFEAALKNRGEARKVWRNPGDWYFQGRVFCGLCGHKLSPRQRRKHRVYECYGTRKQVHVDGTPRCTMRSFRAEELEKAIIERLWNACRDSSILKEAVKAAVAQLKAKRQLLGDDAGIDEQLAGLMGKKERVWDTYHEGGMPKERMLAKIGEIEDREKILMARMDNLDPTARTEIKELQSRIDIINTLLDSGQVSPLTLFEFVNLGDQKDGHALNTDRVRRLLTTFDVKVLVYPDRFEVHGLLPCQTINRNTAQVFYSAS